MKISEKETLEIEKIKSEITKLELEQREIRRVNRRGVWNIITPLVIAIITGLVVWKSNLFQDLQTKIDIQRFQLDQVKATYDSTKIRLNDSLHLFRDSANRLRDSSHYYRNLSEEFKKEAEKQGKSLTTTVKYLTSEKIRLESSIKSMRDSVDDALHWKKDYMFEAGDSRQRMLAAIAESGKTHFVSVPKTQTV